jgi:hypothetical protein
LLTRFSLISTNIYHQYSKTTEGEAGQEWSCDKDQLIPMDPSHDVPPSLPDDMSRISFPNIVWSVGSGRIRKEKSLWEEEKKNIRNNFF